MEIRPYESGDEDKILELFEIVFHRKMSSGYWQWRFGDNPIDKHLIHLMWDGDRLAGHYAVSAINMRIDNEIHKAALSMTTMTHPDYGGRGIFSELSSSLYNELKNERGYKCVIGYPNLNSHYGFIKNLNWSNICICNHLIKDVSTYDKTPCNNIFITENITQEHIDIIDKISRFFRVSVWKDLSYMKWRLEDNPNAKYYIFEYRQNSILEGFWIVKTYPSEKAGIDNVFIVENAVPFENIALIPEFISHIKYYLSEIGLYPETFNTWLPFNDIRHIYYEKYGFCLGGKPTIFGFCPFDVCLNETLSDYRNWYYSYSDSDIY